MIGQTISHYRVVEKLGEGGMGVVYKAEDTKLGRQAALKFLPAHLLGNEDVRRRFEREAKSSAALSHPNVCRVYEIDEAEGKTFLAMELIEGESLDKKIARGPLKLEEALSIAQQVAKGLEAAHKRGIIHRDIKPENIMVGEDGHVTIMDFGLAQLNEASRLTKSDETLGTIAYMSPEQTEGSGTDHRADVWALGVVLYEMVTGRQPFKGDYDKAVMYSILNEEPEPMTGLRTGVPMELELLVDKCLAKEAARRYQNVGEVAVDLGTLADKLKAGRSTIRKTTITPLGGSRADQESETNRSGRGRTNRVLIGVTAIAVLAAIAAVLSPRGSETLPRLRKLSLTAASEIYDPVISPDGRYIAYETGDRPLRTLWVRDLSEEEARMIAGPGDLGPPFWSPTSDAVAYPDGNALKKISPTGGAATTLCEGGSWGAWTPDGNSVVFKGTNGFYVVSAQGGRPTLLFESEHRPKGLYDPFFLPSETGQGKLLYVAAGGAATGRTNSEIFLRDLASGETVSLAKGNRPIYSSPGHIIYESTEAPAGIWALPFSLDTYKPAGEAFVIRESALNPSASSEGTLVYRVSEGESAVRLVRRDRSGKLLGTIGQPQPVMFYPSLSPDESRVAVHGGEGERSIWIHEVNRPVKTRLPGPTTSGGLWSASGLELVFSAMQADTERPRIFRRASDGSGEPELLYASDKIAFVSDWSADGRYLLFDHAADFWYLKENDNERGFTATPFLTAKFVEKAAKISPDGKFVAYVSDESGRYEVYMQRFPEGGRKRQVSLDGGAQPRWRRDGSELFYVKDSTLYAVPIQLGEELSVGGAQELFQDPMLRGTQHPHYDVSADGQRFIVREALSGETDRPAISRTIVVENWYEEFREQERD